MKKQQRAKGKEEGDRIQNSEVSKKKGNACAKIIHEPSSIAAAPFISLVIDQYRQ
jgi:hypothetical protein